MVICSNCGHNAGESKFCPECGTKIEKESINKLCPNCGSEICGSKFCPNCGWSESRDSSDKLDKIIDIDSKLSGKFSRALGKSRAVDKIFDKTASIGLKYADGGDNVISRKQWEVIEPVFLEVLDTIEDEFIRAVLMIERNILGSGGGSALGVVISSVYVPTKGMPHDEAVAFYQEWADNIAQDIEKEKQKGTFNKEKYYKKRLKDSTLENLTLVGIPKSFKLWKDNQ